MWFNSDHNGISSVTTLNHHRTSPERPSVVEAYYSSRKVFFFGHRFFGSRFSFSLLIVVFVVLYTLFDEIFFLLFFTRRDLKQIHILPWFRIWTHFQQIFIVVRSQQLSRYVHGVCWTEKKSSRRITAHSKAAMTTSRTFESAEKRTLSVENSYRVIHVDTKVSHSYCHCLMMWCWGFFFSVENNRVALHFELLYTLFAILIKWAHLRLQSGGLSTKCAIHNVIAANTEIREKK